MRHATGVQEWFGVVDPSGQQSFDKGSHLANGGSELTAIPIRMTITLIHGTFAKGRRFPELQSALSERFGTAVVSPYDWRGWNSTRSRLRAANELVSRLRHFEGPHFLIGHSHGGSVALYAALKLSAEGLGGVVSLNTPFVSVHRRRPWVRHAMPWICMGAAFLVSGWIAWNIPGVSAAAYRLSHSFD